MSCLCCCFTRHVFSLHKRRPVHNDDNKRRTRAIYCPVNVRSPIVTVEEYTKGIGIASCLFPHCSEWPIVVLPRFYIFHTQLKAPWAHCCYLHSLRTFQDVSAFSEIFARPHSVIRKFLRGLSVCLQKEENSNLQVRASELALPQQQKKQKANRRW